MGVAAVRHRDATCVYPGCRRAAESCDLDHINPYHTGPPDDTVPPDKAGATTPANLAPLCRRHHRAKTHPSPASTGSTTVAWDYHQLTPTTWLWTSPHGIRLLVHPDGTTEL